MLPISIYLLWVFLKRKSRQKNYIDAEYKVVNQSQKTSEFAAKNSNNIPFISLENKGFTIILFVTLILIIFSLIFIIITTKPIKYEDIQQQQKITVE